MSPARVPALPWVTAPPVFAVASALERLRRSGAVDERGELTPAGRMQARLPVSWVGARILTAPPAELAAALCELVAIMEVGRDLLDPHPTERQAEARQTLFETAVDEVDVALRCLRRGDPGRHGLRGRVHAECRRMATSLKRLVAAPEADPPAHDVVARFVAAALPDLVFVRRTRADRAKEAPSLSGEPWGNGEAEVFLQPYRVPSAEDPPEPPRAGVLLEQEWLGVGQRARGVGRLLMRLRLRDLVALGLGETHIDGLRIRGGAVEAQVVRTYAGVTLCEGAEVLRGEPLRSALVELVLRGTAMKGLAVKVHDLVHAWSVLAAWGRREKVELPCAPASAQTWLRSRFDLLGVQSLEDLGLLEHEDVVPDIAELAITAGMDPRLALALPGEFPRILELPGGRYACTVDVPTRTVELAPLGSTKKEPSAGLLPRFRGFSVVFVKASRRLKLR